MNGPDDLEPRLAELLGAEKASTDLSNSHRDALLARFEAALAGSLDTSSEPSGSTGSAAPPATLPSAPISSLALAKGAGLVLLGGVLGAFAHAGLTTPASPRPAAPLPTVAAEVTSLATLVPADLPDAPWVEPSARRPESAAVPSTRVTPGIDAGPPTSDVEREVAESDASPRPGRTTLTEERAIVERGRAALARRDGVSSLEALREHRRQFPSGQLAEERDALLVQALAVAGHPDDARQKAREFNAKYPQSVFAGGVDETLRQLR